MPTTEELQQQIETLKELLKQQTPTPQAPPVDPLAAAREQSRQVGLSGERRDFETQRLPGEINRQWQQQKLIPAVGLVPVKRSDAK